MSFLREKIKRARFLVWILPLCSAILFTLSSLAATTPLLAFGALLPLFFFLDDIKKTAHAFWGGFIFGAFLLGWTTRWLFDVTPLDWAGITNPFTGKLLAGGLWLISSLILSLCAGAACVAWKKTAHPYRIFLVPAWWVVFEYARSVLFSVLWIGPGSSIGSYWTFGSVGYAFAHIPLLLPSARLLGLYGAGFLVVLANAALYHAARKIPGANTRLAGAGIIIAALLVYGKSALNWQGQQGIAALKQAALVQTNFRFNILSSKTEVEQAITQERSLFKETARQNPNLVVIPETSPTAIAERSSFSESLAGLFNNQSDYTIIYPTGGGADAPFTTIWYDAILGQTASSEKSLLAPGGEYIPYLVEWTLAASSARDILQTAKKAVASQKGNSATRLADPNNPPKEGVLVCSAIFAPNLWNNLTRSGAQILINPANQSAFQGSFFHEQTIPILRFVAAMNDRWFLQTTNGGISYIIDNNGVVRGKTGKDNSVLSGIVEYRTTMPIAVRFGEWMLSLSFLFCAGHIGAMLWKKIVKIDPVRSPTPR